MSAKSFWPIKGFMACLVAFCGCLYGQIDTAPIPPGRDSGDLFERASSSRIVVVATVIKSEGVHRRIPSGESSNRIRSARRDGVFIADLTDLFGGMLFTVEVDKVLCREGYFGSIASDSAIEESGNDRFLHIFLPHDDPVFVDNHPKEWLDRGEKYLLFLVEADLATQEEWKKQYQLSPSMKFHRGHQYQRGIVPLVSRSGEFGSSPHPHPVLGRIVDLCRAVEATDVNEKLKNLKELASSADTIMQAEAKKALESLLRQVQKK